jgi:hypothetical protein
MITVYYFSGEGPPIFVRRSPEYVEVLEVSVEKRTDCVWLVPTWQLPSPEPEE